jgi:superfamily II DNA helicase RecQ
MALTATSTKKVKGDIMEHLQLIEDNTDVIFKSPDNSGEKKKEKSPFVIPEK